MLSFDLVLGLLAVVAVLAAIGRRISLPNPIAFALGGLLLALVPNVPKVGLSPSLVLIVFLPPLIYAAAQDTAWAEVKEHARPILLMAVGLVLITMVAVAAITHALMPGLPWAAALTLGAIVGPPDAVAAKAIADTLRLPRRLVAVLEGEGLFNDATALVAFQIASAAMVAGSGFDPVHSTYRLAFAAVVAVIVGFVVSWLGLKVIRQIDDATTENTVLLLLPFATYLLAERVHASGVLAVLILALQINQFGGRSVSSEGRLIGRALWEMIDFLLTGLSFVLVGLQLRSVLAGLGGYPTRQVILVSTAVCLVVILIRPVWVFGVAWGLRFFKQGLRPGESPSAVPPQSLVVVSWAGMRGVVSLAVALSLPQKMANGQPFPGRDMIIFVTFVVILATLVGQGLTLPLLIRRLGVKAEGDVADKELSIRLQIAQAARGKLNAIAETGQYPDTAVDIVRGHYEERIAHLEKLRNHTQPTEEGGLDGELPAIQELKSSLLKFEQKELQRLRDGGEVEAPMARNIQKDVDVSRIRTKHTLSRPANGRDS